MDEPRAGTGYFETFIGWTQLGLVAVAALVLGFALLRYFARRRPGRQARSVVIAQYEPPARITPFTAAIVHREPKRAMPAFVLHHAVRGALRMQDSPYATPEKHAFVLILEDPSKADGRAGEWMLAGFFGSNAQPGTPFDFALASKSVRDRFSLLWSFSGWHGDAARYRVEETPGFKQLFILLGVMAAVASFGIAAGGGSVTHDTIAVVVMAVIGIIIGVAGMAVATWSPPSVAGAKLGDHLAGLREFISWAEADRIRMLQSPDGAERRRIDVHDPQTMLHLYEPLLPYAVIFGLEKAWVSQLGPYYAMRGDGPDWYSGGSSDAIIVGGDTNSFADSIGDFTGDSASEGGWGDFGGSSSDGDSGGGDSGGGGDGGGGGD